VLHRRFGSDDRSLGKIECGKEERQVMLHLLKQVLDGLLRKTGKENGGWLGLLRRALLYVMQIGPRRSRELRLLREQCERMKQLLDRKDERTKTLELESAELLCGIIRGSAHHLLERSSGRPYLPGDSGRDLTNCLDEMLAAIRTYCFRLDVTPLYAELLVHDAKRRLVPVALDSVSKRRLSEESHPLPIANESLGVSIDNIPVSVIVRPPNGAKTWASDGLRGCRFDTLSFVGPLGSDFAVAARPVHHCRRKGTVLQDEIAGLVVVYSPLPTRAAERVFCEEDGTPNAIIGQFMAAFSHRVWPFVKEDPNPEPGRLARVEYGPFVLDTGNFPFAKKLHQALLHTQCPPNTDVRGGHDSQALVSV
jgi:hypothetical protein